MDQYRPAVRVVVDTSVVAYLLLRTEPFHAECERFWSAVKEPLAPASWEAEIANVLWQSVRAAIIDVSEALRRLDLAAKLSIHSVPSSSLWSGALARACTTNVAAYDALFVELAVRESVPLATFDKQLTSAFPRHAMRPSVALRAASR
jgi:predicted nucleic acid-binding protein